MERISLAHGNGGQSMRRLIQDVFARHLHNDLLDTQADAAALPPLQGEGTLVVTTDSFTVQPLEFPGGDIGALAVHGTVNDLAVAGALPRYLSLSALIEEGLELEVLDRVVRSLAEAARQCGVCVVTGDTKVVRRGEGGGLYLTATGIGLRPKELNLGIRSIRSGDAILVSGPVGNHGAAVMLARGQFGLRGELRSDAASVVPLAQALLPLSGLRFMRDPTRGGLATVLHEIAQATGCGIRVQRTQIPVAEEVAGACEILGYDPLYLACEGRVVAVLAEHQAHAALAAWRTTAGGERAALIGRMTDRYSHVVLKTELGGERILEPLEDDPLPRIC